MRRARYTAWHRARVFAAYERTRSARLAALAAHVSLAWAYKTLAGAAKIATPTPVYPARLLLEAERLYVEERLSCRAVAAVLAQRHEIAPSQQWVFDHLRRRGVLRTKSETNRLWQNRKYGRDYQVDLPVRARSLAAQRAWSVRRIAKALGISRNAVRGYLPPEDRCTPSEATHRSCWQAALPATRKRRERLVQVLELRLEGHTLDAIVATVGVSKATVSAWLRRNGLTRPRKPHLPEN